MKTVDHWLEIFLRGKAEQSKRHKYQYRDKKDMNEVLKVQRLNMSAHNSK